MLNLNDVGLILVQGINHRSLDILKRLGNDDLVLLRLQRDGDAGHTADELAPLTGCVDDAVGGDIALVGLHALDLAAFDIEADDLGVVVEFRAVSLGCVLIGKRQLHRVETSLAGAVGAAQNLRGIEIGGNFLTALGIQIVGIKSEISLCLYIALQLLFILFIVCGKEISAVADFQLAGLQSELFLQVSVLIRGQLGHSQVGLCCGVYICSTTTTFFTPSLVR